MRKRNIDITSRNKQDCYIQVSLYKGWVTNNFQRENSYESKKIFRLCISLAGHSEAILENMLTGRDIKIELS